MKIASEHESTFQRLMVAENLGGVLCGGMGGEVKETSTSHLSRECINRNREMRKQLEER